MNAEWGASGRTDASGVAVLRTNVKYPGVPLGSYKVAVSKTDIEPHPEWADLPMEDLNYRKYLQISETLKPIHYVESQYASIKDTPLRGEVTAKGKTYPIDAGKKAKSK